MIFSLFYLLNFARANCGDEITVQNTGFGHFDGNYKLTVDRIYMKKDPGIFPQLEKMDLVWSLRNDSFELQHNTTGKV
jgi:hypothetical protein